MKPLTKLYIKCSVVTGLSFGIINTIWDLISKKEFLIWKTLFFTIVFGLIFSTMMLSKLKKRMKEIGIKEITDETLKIKQSKIIIADTSKANLIENIKNDPIFGKMNMTTNDNTLNLRTGRGWISWGEKIQIIITDCNNGLNSFSISSSPILKTAIVDYGKSIENIRRIEKLINLKAA